MGCIQSARPQIMFQSIATRAEVSLPELETERLVLRAYQSSDLDVLAQIWADPAVTRFIGNQPRPRAQVWAAMERSFGSWIMLGYGFWVVTDKAKGEILGECGLMEALRDMSPPISGVPEAGWVFGANAWGRGYASEALGAVFAWADQSLDCAQTVCIIDPENSSSLRLAARIGYKVARTSTFMDAEVYVLERPRCN
tara:strand:+ start:716 stop:1306 length:591 start_codon:yes stop_codon:yes gene_type:complete